MSARPFLKWVGSKRYLTPEILKRLPKRINTYIEPFTGGGAIFFALSAEPEIRFGNAFLNDKNIELMLTYSEIKNHPAALIRELEKHVYDKDYYYKIRALDPVNLSDSKKAARFIYLNRTCFNGLYRVNKSGKFNVPFGQYKDPMICDGENLFAVSRALKSTQLDWLDFANSMFYARPGDAVYCDPPYWPLSQTSNFTAYSADGFGYKEQVQLRDAAAELVSQGVYVLLSNSDTLFTRELYKGFKIETVEAPRRVNSKAEGRGNVKELLISGRSK